jgi:hypothetical protein
VDATGLDAYPTRRRVAWDEVDSRVVLALPRTLSPVERLVSRFLPIPNVRLVSLEGPAARFWLLADGTRTLRDIARALHDDASAGDMEARALRFAQDLVQRGFLVLQDAPRAADDALRGLTPALGWSRLACRRCRTTHPLRVPPGARWFCPRCRKLNQVPLGP